MFRKFIGTCVLFEIGGVSSLGSFVDNLIWREDTRLDYAIRIWIWLHGNNMDGACSGVYVLNSNLSL